MGTTGSIKSGIYQQRIEAHGHVCLVPNEDDQESLVMGGIYKIKAGDLGAARRLLEWAADGLRARGAGAIVLGCTEIPIVIEDGGDVVDATRALAAACVRRFAAADATP
jgi:aspartate racemase